MEKGKETNKKALIIAGIFFLVFLGGAGYSWQQNGSVRLLPADKKALASCESFFYDPLRFESSERFYCYHERIAAITKTFGLARAVALFKEYLRTPDGQLLAGARCHALGHTMGLVAVETHTAGEEILESCGNFCGFGCINGAAHAILLAKEISRAEEFCDIEKRDREVRNGCYHGIGHGVGEYTNLDLVRGLELCSKLKSKEARYQCGHAVIMASDLVNAEASDRIPDDTAVYCAGLIDEFRNSCYEFAGYLDFARSKSAESAFRTCRKILAPDLNICLMRIGEGLFFAFGTEAAKIAESCGQGFDFEQRQCLKGANRIALDGPDSSRGELGAKICANAGSQADACMEDLLFLFEERYGEDAGKNFCRNLEPRPHTACASGDL